MKDPWNLDFVTKEQNKEISSRNLCWNKVGLIVYNNSYLLLVMLLLY